MAHTRTSGFTVPFGGHMVKKVWQLGHSLFTDPYRPEQHYMRGPGPKWREKHGQRPADASLAPAGMSRLSKA